MIDVGTLGGSLSRGIHINNSGQVVGWSLIAEDKLIHAFLYSEGKMIDLGNLSGAALNESLAYGINNSGQVTGEAQGTPSSPLHAFLYSGRVMTDIGTLGGYRSTGFAINNSGQVTGGSTTAADNSPWHAFLYSKGVMTDLGTLGGTISTGSGINDAGEVVGNSTTADDASAHAFLYSKGVMIDLNSLLPAGSGWYLSHASAINNSGEITGFGSLNGIPRAFIMRPGKGERKYYPEKPLALRGLNF